jgi:hypothetical protein
LAEGACGFCAVFTPVTTPFPSLKFDSIPSRNFRINATVVQRANSGIGRAVQAGQLSRYWANQPLCAAIESF